MTAGGKINRTRDRGRRCSHGRRAKRRKAINGHRAGEPRGHHETKDMKGSSTAHPKTRRQNIDQRKPKTSRTTQRPIGNLIIHRMNIALESRSHSSTRQPQNKIKKKKRACLQAQFLSFLRMWMVSPNSYPVSSAISAYALCISRVPWAGMTCSGLTMRSSSQWSSL